jgi:PSP1-like protein
LKALGGEDAGRGQSTAAVPKQGSAEKVANGRYRCRVSVVSFVLFYSLRASISTDICCRDRRKLTFYFVADKRIDFRELVRELFRCAFCVTLLDMVIHRYMQIV